MSLDLLSIQNIMRHAPRRCYIVYFGPCVKGCCCTVKANGFALGIIATGIQNAVIELQQYVVKKTDEVKTQKLYGN